MERTPARVVPSSSFSTTSARIDMSSSRSAREKHLPQGRDVNGRDVGPRHTPGAAAPRPPPLPRYGGRPTTSVRHQNGYLGTTDHRDSRTPENPLTQPRMSESAHDDQVRAELRRPPLEDIGAFPPLARHAGDGRADAVPAEIGGKSGAGLGPVPLEGGNGIDQHDMDLARLPQQAEG